MFSSYSTEACPDQGCSTDDSRAVCPRQHPCDGRQVTESLVLAPHALQSWKMPSKRQTRSLVRYKTPRRDNCGVIGVGLG